MSLESPTEYRKLFRSQSEAVLNGVCAGLGNYFRLDINLIRFLFILLAFFSFSSIIIYIFLAIVIPKNPEESEESKEPSSVENNIVILVFFLFLFSFFLLITYFNVPFFINIWSISFVLSLALFLLFMASILSYFLYMKFDFKTLSKYKTARSERLVYGCIAGFSQTIQIDKTVLRTFAIILCIFLVKLVPLFVIVYLCASIFLPEKIS